MSILSSRSPSVYCDPSVTATADRLAWLHDASDNDLDSYPGPGWDLPGEADTYDSPAEWPAWTDDFVWSPTERVEEPAAASVAAVLPSVEDGPRPSWSDAYEPTVEDEIAAGWKLRLSDDEEPAHTFDDLEDGLIYADRASLVGAITDADVWPAGVC